MFGQSRLVRSKTSQVLLLYYYCKTRLSEKQETKVCCGLIVVQMHSSIDTYWQSLHTSPHRHSNPPRQPCAPQTSPRKRQRAQKKVRGSCTTTPTAVPTGEPAVFCRVQQLAKNIQTKLKYFSCLRKSFLFFSFLFSFLCVVLNSTRISVKQQQHLYLFGRGVWSQGFIPSRSPRRSCLGFFCRALIGFSTRSRSSPL